MGFLLKHYEKILLAVLLTVFIGLLAFQLVLWRQSEQIQVEKLKEFKDPPPNYQPVKFGDEKSPFRVLETLSAKPAFGKAQPRERNTTQIDSQILFTDLMLPYPMSVCPYCNRVIPANAFPSGDGESKCPLEDCRKTLHAPFNVISEKDLDTDGDGIPDKDEQQMGLNPKFAADGNADADGDGFTNYEEYICKTDCNNPKSRPPYHEKMFVMPIVRRKLPFRLKKISFRDPSKKDTAEIEMSVERPGSTSRTSFVKMTEKENVFPKIADFGKSRNAQQYIVVDVIPKIVRSGATEVNESKVVVQKYNPRTKKGEGDRIVAEIGRELYEPRVRADLIMGAKPLEIYIGSKFSQGDIKTGIDHYSVVTIDDKKNIVTLKYTGENRALIGKTFQIGQSSMLQNKIDAIQKSKRPRRGRKKSAENPPG